MENVGKLRGYFSLPDKRTPMSIKIRHFHVKIQTKKWMKKKATADMDRCTLLGGKEGVPDSLIHIYEVALGV